MIPLSARFRRASSAPVTGDDDLAVQGGQAAAAFRPLGVAIGTVITVAGIAAGVLFGLGRDTEDASDAADRFGKTEDRLKDLLRVTTSDIHDQADAVADFERRAA
jgi:hypothetical protein